jgi:(1->4)-alpha-D-glucan 1-alpha-D-glucosylmutase
MASCASVGGRRRRARFELCLENPGWADVNVNDAKHFVADPSAERVQGGLMQTQQTDLAPLLQPRIPLATYRLQFNSDFTFNQAREIVPYLSALGITHLYASPYLKSRPGSRHGYATSSITTR